ncbi:MAG: hypothetical protein IH621_13355 [Krumholzibacteria bacterium]|nr:hypothetical protein [Candidatus Krumholzibacteria bacterium]
MNHRTATAPARRCAATGAAVLALALAAVPAAAQWDFPRIGLSAAPDRYVDALTAEVGEEFTLYACVFAHEPDQPLQQQLSLIPWVVHQACCGAWMDVISVELNPALEHVGASPLSGMVSSAAACLDQEGIMLAALTVRLDAPGPGDYIWAAGPYALVEDCEGGHPVFMDMPVTITVPGTTPTEASRWGALKALYR